MKIIEQRVQLLEPEFNNPNEAKQTWLMEYCGRNCYQSHNRMNKDSAEPFIKNLIEKAHETPLEFASATVEILTSRDIMAQLTRHRLASFCIESTRYNNYTKDGCLFIKPQYYVPQGQGLLDAKAYCASRYWEQVITEHEAAYMKMINEYGRKPEEARGILGGDLAVDICMRANLREWRHILDLRLDHHAQLQMRILVNMILKALKEAIPYVFDDYEVDNTLLKEED